MEKEIRLLAIETSCDETAAAVVKNGREVLSNVIHTQIDIHTIYGGVVPEIASREHIAVISQVTEKALKDAGLTLGELDGIGVTFGPGLVGALLVGVSMAKAMAFGAGLPLIGVNHIEGHICANFLEYPALEPPFLCLVVSGGHTHLAQVLDYGVYRLIGRTRDDAAGEAFDKVARAVGLGYPGGPKIDAAAKGGDPFAFSFPQAKVNDSPYDFSFSGLKSAVLNLLHHAEQVGEKLSVPDLAASFQESVIEVLCAHTLQAAEEFGADKLVLAGGVAANSALRRRFEEECGKRKLQFYCPRPALCTDNAAMIGSAAYFRFVRGIFAGWDLNAVPNLALGEG